MTSAIPTTDFLHHGVYEPAFIGRLVGMRPSTVRTWLATSPRFSEGDGVIKRHPTTEKPFGSFLDLVELFIVAELVREGVPLRKLRAVMVDLRGRVKVDHPLARSQVLRDHHCVFLAGLQGEFIELGRGGQLGIPEIVVQRAKAIDFGDDGLAETLWPLGRDHPVVIEPGVCFGSPRVTDTRIQTEVLYRSWLAEKQVAETVAFLYEVSVEKVNEAVEFEKKMLLAA